MLLASVHSLNFHPDMVGDEVGSLAMSLGRRMSERAFAGRLETAVAEFNEGKWYTGDAVYEISVLLRLSQ